MEADYDKKLKESQVGLYKRGKQCSGVIWRARLLIYLLDL
jgi:hypothetical protein